MSVCVVLMLMLLMAALLADGGQPLSTTLLSPPPGNSLTVTALTLAGNLKYICKKDDGQWLLVQKKATLVDPKDQTKVMGFYVKNYRDGSFSRHVGTWTMINSEGDEAESGHHLSLVSGRQIASIGNNDNGTQDFLAQASLHRHEGAARRLSYIAQLNMRLLAIPPTLECGMAQREKLVAFEAKYNFWSQDMMPPEVPSYLMVPSQSLPVESFFAQGNVRFEYDHKNKAWMQRRMLARIYDVPGGMLYGGFSYKLSKPNPLKPYHEHSMKDLACITINNPNGLQICGIQEIKDSSTNHQSSLPWALFHATISKGNITRTMGRITYFQMVSTWGGLLPQHSNQSTMLTNGKGCKSGFTAIFWIYRSKVLSKML